MDLEVKTTNINVIVFEMKEPVLPNEWWFHNNVLLEIF